MKVKYFFYILLLALAAFIVYRISDNSGEKNKETNKGKNQMAAKVTGIVLVPQEFSDQLSLSGSIEANEQVDIRSEVLGIVESINFTEGTNVSKGQVLFKVNDLELRAQLGKAKTAQGLASENARRAKLLLDKEAISQEEYEISTADFKSAQSESQLIQAQIAKTSVRAPFSGKIGLRAISKGTYVTPETVVAKLVNNTQVKITFSVPEKYSSQMQKNGALTFTVSGSKEKYTAKIYALEPEVDVNTRTLRVRAIADNSNGKLLPGTFAKVALPLEKITDALFVPTEALIPIQNGKKVFVTRGGKAKEIIVEAGARTDKNVLITEGLKAGDTVLTTGVMSLKDGASVKVSVVK